MKLVTWNINSVRLRLPLLLKLIEEQQPDIICLQETKCPDEHFPLEEIKAAGYPYIHFHGMKSYNGLAIISKIPFEETEIHNRVGREDCRHVAAKFKDFTLHNLYIPAGGDEPDVEVNDKFAHKLDFVDEMSAWFAEEYSKEERLIVVGDFNIAPYEHDVWSHKQLLKIISHTPIEVEKLARMYESLDWVDVAREFVPMDEKCYTWWSYRNRDWRKSNRGRRLDHIWVTQGLKSSLLGHEVLDVFRDCEKPSDHAPVVAELDL